MNKYSLDGRDIVIVGQQSWDTNIGSNCKDIALEFSKHNRVLYVNPPLDRITLLRRKSDPYVKKQLEVIDNVRSGIRQINENLWELDIDVIIESIRWLRIRWLFNLLNKRNNYIFSRSISSAIGQLGFKNIILFNDNDIFRSFYLKEYLKPSLSIYYSRDYMLGVDYWKFHGKVLEPELIRKSDLIIANSTYLTNYCKQYNENARYVGQGCDLRMFLKKPVDNVTGEELGVIAGIRGPKIGYVGSLNSDRLDINIILHIARNRPDWSIILVGPADDKFEASELKQLPNVYFTGLVAETRLPLYLNFFDVCINPQLVNEITIGNYPRKIDEYLAVGKPVVATATEAMEIFREYVYLADSPSDYVRLIDNSLKDNTVAMELGRQEFAKEHSWENSVNLVYKSILETEKGF
ncbi:glycosyltransferase [Pedobacter antarcticus]|uniref:glycosyltransferase n=1 Tax=Pedobacter antarcticus TaxID=34086 RepID=UPI00292ED14C|nr:glycosyltransferase [Pedobacter antarcticus]